MDRASWRARIGPPTALLVTVLIVTAVTPAAIAASLRPAAAKLDACPATNARVAAAGALRKPLGGRPNARVESQITDGGELTGRRLRLQAASGATIDVSLPVESSVSPIVGSLVVYTRHTAAAGSDVRALNVETGCDVRLAAPREIVRSAVLDPAANALYVHSVTRSSRSDAGVVRYDLASGSTAHVVEPLQPSDEIGPIFGTDLRWSVDGSWLAVQSCGFSRCLTRVLNTATGQVALYDGSGQGAIIALTADHLVTYSDCPGLPCAVISTDLATGAISVLAEDAFEVTAADSTAGTASLSIESSAGSVEVVQ